MALLVLFVVATGLALERAFFDSARSAREARLVGHIYLLISAAEADDGNLQLPEFLEESRFGVPGSGLYGAVADAEGNLVWRSRSSLGRDIPFIPRLSPGRDSSQLRKARDDGEPYLVQGLGVRWATGDNPKDFTFSVAEDLAELRSEATRFRSSLTAVLGVMGILLIVALVALLRWGLRPLQRVAREVSAIEDGSQQRLSDDYPRELRALTHNLNALLAHSEARQARLGNALGDLAHSLKTPLSVMRGTIAESRLDADTAQVLNDHVANINRIIDYQLQRARTGASQHPGLASRIPLRQIAERVAGSLQKMYPAKGVTLENLIAENADFHGNEGDLMEVLGNLLDNAFKWCRERVRVLADRQHTELRLVVEDDGPGIAPGIAQHLLERGARADESSPGHGIGLAVVRETAEAYGGRVRIERSQLGGTRVLVTMQA